jgi:hypothetical protein
METFTYIGSISIVESKEGKITEINLKNLGNNYCMNLEGEAL